MKSFKQVSKLINNLDPSGLLYLVYINLNGFVHPSSSEVLHYADTRTDPPGLLLRPALARRSLAWTVAFSTLLSNAVYFDLIRGKPHKSAISKIASAVNLPLWLTADGKPPKSKPPQ